MLRKYATVFFCVCILFWPTHVSSYSNFIPTAGNRKSVNTFVTGDAGKIQAQRQRYNAVRLHLKSDTGTLEKKSKFENIALPQTVDVGTHTQSSAHTHTPSPVSLRETLRKRRENVSQKVAQMLYEDMVKGRVFEDMVAQMYYRGQIAGFVHLYNGQEAVSSGVIKALRQDDVVVSTYRDHVHAISKGVHMNKVMAELYGKETGCSKGRGGSMHMFDSENNLVGGFAYIAENIPVALGIAFSMAYKKNVLNDQKSNSVCVCFLGDGASNNGQFYESLNMAAIAKLPIIFVVENNNWAIGMASHRSTAVPEIYKRAKDFGLPGVEVDGMDVLAVRSVAREAIDRARKGYGPTVIEAMTYRFRGHSLADPDELRVESEKSAFLERDPIVQFGEYMKLMGYANDEVLKQTNAKIRQLVEESVKFAQTSADPKTEDISKYIFAEAYKPEPEMLSDELKQRYAQALKEELDSKERRKAGDKTPPQPVYLQTDPLPVID